MNNWGTLSHEILRIIFLYLESPSTCDDQKYLAQCALTCCGWRLNAQAIYFSKVILITTEQLNTMNCLVLTNPMLEKWVKSLDVRSAVSEFELLEIDMLFPRLEELEFLYCDEVTYSFFCEMIIEGGKFCNLKEIPKPSSETECESYLQCCMFMENRINCIKFKLEDNFRISTDVCKYLHNKLHQFPYLKEICLLIEDVEKSRYCILDYLESLTKNGITSIQKYSLSLFNYTTNMPYSTEQLNSVLSIHPAINVKQLNLEIGLYTSSSPVLLSADKFVLYIMKNFPHLNSIRLNNKFDDKLG